MQLSGLEIQRATHGCWHGSVPEKLCNIVTDTRNFKAGAAFLALRGPSFDGHAFAASIADDAIACIGDNTGIQTWQDLNSSVLEVADTLQAFGDIAHAWRQRLQHTTVIAISGSYGKTSLRSMLETGFTALNYQVAATHANLNNLIGVPQTLLAVPTDADIAIIECGISERGEMARLAAIVQADISILTGITAAHAEGLGGLSGVVQEKALLLNHASWCALGAGVAQLLEVNHIALPQAYISMQLSMQLSMQQDSHACVSWTMDGCKVQFSYQDQHAEMLLSLPAAHWAANLAFAATIMLRYFNHDNLQTAISLQRVMTALAHWQPQSGRLQAKAGRHDCMLLDDCYNANPVSMQAAIDTLRALDGKRIAILGDMAELGDASEAAHTGIDISDLDHVYLIGTRMHALAAAHPEADWFANTDAALTALADLPCTSTDSILIKGSRSMQLEKIVQLLHKQEGTYAV